MDYNPRSETIRLLAAAAYLPFVAIGLLLQPQYREVRLVRFHCYQAIALGVILAAALTLGSALASVLSGMPALGYELSLLVGVAVLGLMLAVTGAGFYGAIVAYQGNYTRVPLLTTWVWARVNGEIAEEEAPPPRKKRRRPPPTDL